MKNQFKFNISLDEDGNFEALFTNSKKLSTALLKGKVILMEEEEKMLEDIKKMLQNYISTMAFNGYLSDYTLTGNMGVSK